MMRVMCACSIFRSNMSNERLWLTMLSWILLERGSYFSIYSHESVPSPKWCLEGSRYSLHNWVRVVGCWINDNRYTIEDKGGCFSNKERHKTFLLFAQKRKCTTSNPNIWEKNERHKCSLNGPSEYKMRACVCCIYSMKMKFRAWTDKFLPFFLQHFFISVLQSKHHHHHHPHCRECFEALSFSIFIFAATTKFSPPISIPQQNSHVFSNLLLQCVSWFPHRDR
jgi:hypothetical protein